MHKPFAAEPGGCSLGEREAAGSLVKVVWFGPGGFTPLRAGSTEVFQDSRAGLAAPPPRGEHASLG
jgi:hypothetical protein